MDSKFPVLAGGLGKDQERALTSLATGGPLTELRRAFPDPGEAFICSPIQLSMRDLARLYMDSVPDDRRARFPVDLRERARDERWLEQRAVFQARRVSSKRDALINAEAEVWAVFGLEFHGRRIRQLMERWEAMTAYVQQQLDALEAGERGFSTGLSQAMSELRTIEKDLEDLMPALQLNTRALDIINRQAADRQEVAARITERLMVVKGSERAASVFDTIALDSDQDGRPEE